MAEQVGNVAIQTRPRVGMSERARWVVRQLPPLARRDERIAELREANRELRDTRRQMGRRLMMARRESQRLREALATAHREREDAEARFREETETAVAAAVATARLQPSFGAQLQADRRAFNVTRQELRADPRLRLSPRMELLSKLRSYRFAESHGVLVPEVLSVWSDLADIDWDELPERFVLKSVRGYSSQGVFPLHRAPGGFRVVGRPEVLTPDDVTATLRRREARGLIVGPYFAEALLSERTDPHALPTDHKLYTFYGRVGHVLLRRVIQHGKNQTAHWQYLDRDGRDLGDVVLGRSVSTELPAPANLGEFVEIAERLSLAVPTPLLRVDLYDTPQGVCFGEFTIQPGGQQEYREDHDQALGKLWEEAEGRLRRDLSNGRPFALTYGPHPARTPDVPMWERRKEAAPRSQELEVSNGGGR